MTMDPRNEPSAAETPATPEVNKSLHLVGGVYDAEKILAQSESERKLITINLLRDHTVAVEESDPVVVGVPEPAAASAPAGIATTAAAAPATKAVAKLKSKYQPIIIGVVSLAVIGVVLLIIVLARGPKLAPLAVNTTPTPKPTVAPTPTPTPAPSPSPTPTPQATPAPTAIPSPQTVTAPKETPTPEHPQDVTIKSPSGLWLRSTPTSVNKSNIIGWMPNGATIKVDGVGEFWWHGIYKGQSGYFASAYTN